MSGDSPVGQLGFDKAYTAENGGGVAEAAHIAALRFHEVMLVRWKKLTEQRPVTQSLPVATLPVAVSFSPNDEWSALRTHPRHPRACRAWTYRPSRKAAPLFSWRT